MGALINFWVPFFLPNFLRGLIRIFGGGHSGFFAGAKGKPRGRARGRVCVCARIQKKNIKRKPNAKKVRSQRFDKNCQVKK